MENTCHSLGCNFASVKYKMFKGIGSEAEKVKEKRQQKFLLKDTFSSFILLILVSADCKLPLASAWALHVPICARYQLTT